MIDHSKHTTMTEYQIKYQQAQNGKITQTEWHQYVIKVLFEIMNEPEIKAVFKRLKHT